MRYLGLCVLPVLAMGAVVGRAQQVAFSTRTAGVRLDVSVLDGPRAIHGLDVRNFEVLDNRKPQPFTVVETRDAALDLVLVVQPPQSVDSDRQRLVEETLEGFGTLLRDVDRLGVVIASAGPDVVRPLLPVSQGFAATPALTGSGGNTLRDALLRAFLLFDEEDRRKAIVVFTDGQHDRSAVTWTGIDAAAGRQPAQVIAAALSATALRAFWSAEQGKYRVYETVTPLGRDTLEILLPLELVNLTRRTGGRTIDLRKDSAGQQLAELLTHLRSQYVITFQPGTGPTPGWHEVSVRLKGRKGVVVTRAGYWVDGPR